MAWKHHLDDALELAELLRPAWAEISDAIPAWHPRCKGDDEGDGGSDDGDADADADATDEGTQGSDKGHEDSRWDDPPDDDAEIEEWKEHARKWERRAKQNGDRKATNEAKREKKRADDLAAKLAEREDADKTEQERAVEAAREEGRTAALTEAQKERRADRLEVAVTRLAARGIKVKDGDTEKTLRFEDPEDALVFIERAIAKGDLDEDDVFDEDHKVKLDDIEDELAALLTRKPRLAAGTSNGGGEVERRAAGGADGGRGKGAGKGIEDMSVKDHIDRMAQGQK